MDEAYGRENRQINDYTMAAVVHKIRLMSPAI